MANELKTPEEWMRVLDVDYIIVDHDGWRHNDGVTWETPITESDYLERAWQCTIGPKNWGSTNA